MRRSVLGGSLGARPIEQRLVEDPVIGIDILFVLVPTIFGLCSRLRQRRFSPSCAPRGCGNREKVVAYQQRQRAEDH